jgi:hypothetical protein
VNSQRHAPPALPSGKMTPSGTHSIGGWLDPRADLKDVEKGIFLTLPRLELRPIRRAARWQSQYRLRYPGSKFFYFF